MSDFVPSFDAAHPEKAIHGLVSAVAVRPIASSYEAAAGRDAFAYASSLALDAGFVAERVDFFEEDIESLLTLQHPFLYFPLPSRGRGYAVLSTSRRGPVLLDVVGRSVPASRRAAALAFTEGAREHLTSLAERIGASGVGRRDRLVDALRREVGGATPVGHGIVFRPNLAESVPRAVRSLGLGSQLGKVLAQSGLQSVLATGAWALIGSLALSGHADRSSLLGWALVSVTATFVQLVATRFVSRFTMRAATTLRERLLEGALKLEPDGLGSYGLGGLMVIASQADSFLGSVITFLLALLGVLTNLVATAVILSIAPLPGVALLTFFAFVAGVLAMAPRMAKLTRELQGERMRITTDTVERMLGHRTRLVQQTPNSWHDGEDESVHGYAEMSRGFDRLATVLQAAPRVYYVAAALSLFAVLVAKPTQETLAVTIGGMTLGMATLSALVDLVLSGAGLHALWGAIQPVVGDPRKEEIPAPSPVLDGSEQREGGALVELRGVRFQYPGRAKAVLDDVTLVIRAGEHVLVEGPSGGGKTTLAALLTGLRKPGAGLLMVRGLDQHTMQERELRRVIASAPQFYKNHVFAESLAFNLLLGRAWPPSPDDLREADSVVRALGLGALVDRMPAGLFQHVGESGWQLSHGEKSRVFLARTLLQRADLLVLDETFGALDPGTLEQCMKVVLDRAKALVVITHR